MAVAFKQDGNQQEGFRDQPVVINGSLPVDPVWMNLRHYLPLKPTMRSANHTRLEQTRKQQSGHDQAEQVGGEMVPVHPIRAAQVSAGFQVV